MLLQIIYRMLVATGSVFLASIGLLVLVGWLGFDLPWWVALVVVLGVIGAYTYANSREADEELEYEIVFIPDDGSDEDEDETEGSR